MKKSMLLIFILLIGCASAVPLVEKSSIIELPGMSKQQIYHKSMQWITYRFVSGRAVMDYKDPEMGKVIAKGTLFLGPVVMYSVSVHMIATIDCVAGKAKITVVPNGCQKCGNRGCADCPCSYDYLAGWVDTLQPKSEEFIADYIKYMKEGKPAAWDGK